MIYGFLLNKNKKKVGLIVLWFCCTALPCTKKVQALSDLIECLQTSVFSFAPDSQMYLSLGLSIH